MNIYSNDDNKLRRKESSHKTLASYLSSERREKGVKFFAKLDVKPLQSSPSRFSDAWFTSNNAELQVGSQP